MMIQLFCDVSIIKKFHERSGIIILFCYLMGKSLKSSKFHMIMKKREEQSTKKGEFAPLQGQYNRRLIKLNRNSENNERTNPLWDQGSVAK